MNHSLRLILVLTAALLALAGCATSDNLPAVTPLRIPDKGHVARIDVYVHQKRIKLISDLTAINVVLDELTKMTGPIKPPPAESTPAATLAMYDNDEGVGLAYVLALGPDSLGGFSLGKYGSRPVPKAQMARLFTLLGVPRAP